MGGVIGIFLAMIAIGAVTFAPLGYFIYKFSQKNGEPFGDTEPHGDQPSAINDFAENVIAFVKNKLNKNNKEQ